MPLSIVTGGAGGGGRHVPPTLSHSPVPGVGASPSPVALPRSPAASGSSAVSRPPRQHGEI